jgi:hypothetical protein
MTLNITQLPPTRQTEPQTRRLVLATGAALSLWLAGCAGPRKPTTPSAADAAARAYRRDAAQHIYSRYGSIVYKGKLPPLLYAVGTLQVNLDAGGKVQSLNWLRAPRHAPEVITQVERMVRASQPFPAPPGGKVTWTDTWLWDDEGHFQLDTLTEGQLQE